MKKIRNSNTSVDLDTPLTPEQQTASVMRLPISLIDEDPNQPRQEDSPGFSGTSLAELASTIRNRGVKSPISVRNNPKRAGRFLVNHGARRLRASKLAGLDIIPAFIDNDYSEADQVIENLQRNELTAREVADFIGREISRGKKRGEIARSIGKSGAFVTQHANLLDLPDPIAQAFHQGRSRDVTVVNELLTAYKQHPDSVLLWLSDESQELTRSSVKLLRQFLADKESRRELSQSRKEQGASTPLALDNGMQYEAEPLELEQDDQALIPMQEGRGGTVEEPAASYDQTPAFESDPLPGRIRKPRLLVRYQGSVAQLLIHKRSASENMAWIRLLQEGRALQVTLSALELVALQAEE